MSKQTKDVHDRLPGVPWPDNVRILLERIAEMTVELPLLVSEARMLLEDQDPWPTIEDI